MGSRLQPTGRNRHQPLLRCRLCTHVRADAVVIPTLAGERYVVSMFGTMSDWVQNVEAAHGDAIISHRGPVHVRLVPVPPEELAPILQEYLRVASSGRKHFPLPRRAPPTEFAAIAVTAKISHDTSPAAHGTARPADPPGLARDFPGLRPILLNRANGDRRAYDSTAAILAGHGIASLRLDLCGHGERTNLASRPVSTPPATGS